MFDNDLLIFQQPGPMDQLVCSSFCYMKKKNKQTNKKETGEWSLIIARNTSLFEIDSSQELEIKM